MAIEELVAFDTLLDPNLAERLYGLGIFPMPVEGGFGWFLPSVRAAVVLDAWPVRCPRTTRKLLRNHRVALDREPMEVVLACATTPRPGGWIDQAMLTWYRALIARGMLHTVGVYDADDILVGGLFGIGVHGIFVGESMFHHTAEASKLAFYSLVRITKELDYLAIDGQWPTPHLASLGFRSVSREEYKEILAQAALSSPRPWPTGLQQLSDL